jgi:DNA-binding transcriptional LysR family regulator
MVPPVDSIIGGAIMEAFRASGLQPPHARTVSFSIPLCHHLLAGGSFFAMLPISMARLGRHLSLKVLPVEFAGIPRPTGVLVLKNRTLSPIARYPARSAVRRSYGAQRGAKEVACGSSIHRPAPGA